MIFPLDNVDAVERAAIPVERINGAVLMTVAVHTLIESKGHGKRVRCRTKMQHQLRIRVMAL